MLAIDEARRFPRLGLVGFAVIVIGAALDIAVNVGTDAHGMHGGVGYSHNGHLVALGGMLLVMVAVLRDPVARLVGQRDESRSVVDPSRTDRSARWMRGALAATLTLAGALHVVLAPAHFAESALMGLGFLGTAAAELGLAGLVLARPRRMLYLATVGVASAVILLYAYNVMIGLPFNATEAPHTAVTEPLPPVGATAHDDEAQHGAEHEPVTENANGHHAGGIQLGRGEPVDASGALTKVAELAAIGLALSLLRRPR